MRLEINDSDVTLNLETSPGLSVLHPTVRELLEALREMHATLPLDSLDVKPVVGHTDRYTYEWKTLDGREWSQQIDATSAPARMTFDVGDWFSAPEFTAHRRVRDAVVVLLHNGCSEVSGRWS